MKRILSIFFVLASISAFADQKVTCYSGSTKTFQETVTGSKWVPDRVDRPDINMLWIYRTADSMKANHADVVLKDMACIIEKL